MTPRDLKFQGKLDELVESSNIAEQMSKEDRELLGAAAKQQYDSDKASRSEWERKMAGALGLALQVAESRTYPWPNASNVKFPLITVAALGFHARAYPSLVPPSGPVYAGPIGLDPSEDQINAANRVAAHMSYQLQSCTEWEPETDRALIIVPIVGCAFKKVCYDEVTRKRHSLLVLPQSLVVNYWTKDLAMAPAISEEFIQTPNEIYENVESGFWLKKESVDVAVEPPKGPLEAMKDKVQGVQPPSPVQLRAPVSHFIEQHTFVDLDNDGYEEPYIITFDRESGFIRSIVARYMPSGIHRKGVRVLRIVPIEYYVKLPFIPSPDGGFYDIGFGHLLGPLNDAADSLINQLIDAGTMSNLGGGFLGRGMRIRKGDSYFQPREWKTVDSVGDDISKNIYPLPVRDPSQVLLDLVVFLIQYAERIASANEVQAGEISKHNMKAEVFRIADENGSRIYAAIFKRLWRAIGQEFNLFYCLNARVPNDPEYEQQKRWFKIEDGDYSLNYIAVKCAADPDAVTDTQRQNQAILVYKTEAGEGRPTLAAKRRLYKAFNVPNIEELLPQVEPPPPPNVQLITANARAMVAETGRLKVIAEIMEKRAKLGAEVEKINAEISELYAKAHKAMADGDAADDGQAIAALNAALAMRKEKREGIVQVIELLRDLGDNQEAGNDSGTGKSATGTGGTSGGTAVAGVPSLAAPPPDSEVVSFSEGEA